MILKKLKKSNKSISACWMMVIALPVCGQNTVSVETLFDTPEKNIWNGGVYIGADFQPLTGGLMLGLYGRYTLGKIATFSANVAYDYTRLVPSGGLVNYDESLIDKLPAYKNIELRGVFHFKDYQEGTLKSKVKLGRQSQPAEFGKTKTVKYSVQHATKVRVVTGLTASINIQSRFASQRDSTQIFTVTDAAGNDPGIVADMFVAQKNMLIGVGLHLAQYTWFKGNFTLMSSGKMKTRRIRKSIIANFELLYGMTISTGSEAFKIDKNNNLITYQLKDVEKRRLGFRICTDYASNKPGLYQRMELGYRPGIWAPSAGSKFLNQGYIVYGIGVGF